MQHKAHHLTVHSGRIGLIVNWLMQLTIAKLIVAVVDLNSRTIVNKRLRIHYKNLLSLSL